MNRATRRSMSGGAAVGHAIVNGLLAQYGLSPTIGRIAGSEYQRVLKLLESKGCKASDDPFVALVAGLEALYGLAPDKLRPLLPFIQGDRPIPASIPEPFRGLLRGGLVTARAIRSLKRSNGRPLLEIYNIPHEELQRMYDEIGLEEEEDI